MIYYPVPAHRQKMFEAFGGGTYQPEDHRLADGKGHLLADAYGMDNEQLQFISPTKF